MKLFKRQFTRELHNRILAGLVLGGVCGILVHSLVGWFPAFDPPLQAALNYLIGPVGQIFLRLLYMVVIPLVLSSLILGVVGIGDLGRLGKLGAWTFSYFVLVTTLATMLGLTLVNAIGPGLHISEETRAELLETYRPETDQRLEQRRGLSPDFLIEIVPRNPVDSAARGQMLPVIFFALIFGAGITRLQPAKAEPLTRAIEGVGLATVAIIGMIMKMAPFGVFALIFAVAAKFGWALLAQLFYYVFTVLLGLALFQTVGYGLLVRLLGRMSPWDFFRKIRPVMVTAFSTSSSNATLPTTIETAEAELQVPNEIASFVLPLGATINMNGTALFEGVTVLFLAQVFGVELSLGQQVVVALLSVVSAIGTAGVPGGSIPLLAGILISVGVPAEGIGLIIGVDRILDMSRTVLNVSGDLSAAVFVTRRLNQSEKAETGSQRRAVPIGRGRS